MNDHPLLSKTIRWTIDRPTYKLKRHHQGPRWLQANLIKVELLLSLTIKGTYLRNDVRKITLYYEMLLVKEAENAKSLQNNQDFSFIRTSNPNVLRENMQYFSPIVS